jgi:2-phosphosulfolactate phosphatase
MTKTVEVCLSPKLYSEKLTEGDFITVITDIFRATTSVVAALDYGVDAIIPVADLDKAKVLKKQGYIVAAEREGIKPDFADIGNSATEFFRPGLKGKIIAYSTTNGVKAINMSSDAREVILGAFMNLKAVADYLSEKEMPVVIFCSGWKNKVNLEDTLFAGALADMLLSRHGYATNCDSAHLSMDLWNIAKDDLVGYIEKASHRHRLAHLIDENLLNHTFTPDSSKVVPVFKNGKLIRSERSA